MFKFKSIVAVLFVFLLLSCVSTAAGTDEYVSLKKYINMNMYGEAYNEILRYEITRDEVDPALQKLRADMLEETRRQMLKRVKNNTDDPAVYTILADIAFQQTDYDNANIYISKALDIKQNPLSNYVCAKILFCQNNYEQAYNRMSRVLESMPDSAVVFNDFQFLYSCKTYGKESAIQLSQNANFLRRVSPVGAKKSYGRAPKSPFKNDPTKVAKAIPQPIIEDEVVEENIEQADEKPIMAYDGEDGFELEDDINTPLPDEIMQNQIGIKETKKSPKIAKTANKPVNTDEDFGDFDNLDDFDNEFDMAQKKSDNVLPDIEPVKKESTKKAKKEEANPKKKTAENLMAKAWKAFEEEDYQLARDQLESAIQNYPDVADPNDLKKKLNDHFLYYKKYNDAIDYMKLEQYKEAKPLFEEVYKYDPKMYSDVPLYLAQILGGEENPDTNQMLKYLNAIINNKESSEELVKQAKFLKLTVLVDEGKYDEAGKIRKELESKYGSWLKEQNGYKELASAWFWREWGTTLAIVAGALIILSGGIFALGSMNKSIFAAKDPVEEINKAYGAHNYNKAISIGEKALAKGQPVQIERELLETLIHIFFDTNNLEKCQEAAKRILKNFPENNTAWTYLIKTSVAMNDTSNEAITMYENQYKENPSNTDYLPILAKHYIKTNNETPEAFDIILAYYKLIPAEEHTAELIFALADGFVRNRTLGLEATGILEKANRLKEKVEYYELLARNYSKNNDFENAVKACLYVLNKNIDNMGIHVVYTASMKKLQRIPDAILQYNKFLQRYPNNPQLEEIIKGLEKDMEESQTSELASMPSLPSLHDLTAESHFEVAENNQAEETTGLNVEVAEQKVDVNDEAAIENFVEPPPEGFDPNELVKESSESENIPVPDFLKSNEAEVLEDANQIVQQILDEQNVLQETQISKEQEEGQENQELQETQENVVFSEKTENNENQNDSQISLPTFEDFQSSIEQARQNLQTSGSVPESVEVGYSSNLDSNLSELEPAERANGSILSGLDSLNQANNMINENIPTPLNSYEPSEEIAQDNFESNLKDNAEQIVPMPAQNSNVGSTAFQAEEKLVQAQEAAASNRWDEVVYLLSNEYASNRNKEMGMLLIKARLRQNKPTMAMELVDTLELDKEMLPDDMKDMLYNVAVALENAKQYKDALRLYDIICNVDINYKDAFDRSDKMYLMSKA